jgi:phosphopantothenoylcysteine decarboxylase/phosphopantothenate--cysteine ligase
MVDLKSKTLLLEDKTPGLLFMAWPFIEKLREAGFSLIADESALDKNSWLQTVFPFVPHNGLNQDFKIVFASEDQKEENCFTYVLSANKAYNLAPNDALDRVLFHFYPKDYSGKKILISAGPTAEDIDPVRFLTNRSSGKMGLALARISFLRGAHVTLITGPVKTEIPGYLKSINVRSAQDMFEAVKKNILEQDYFISAAAVADYTPAEKAINKIKKSDSPLKLDLVRTTDILEYAGKNKSGLQKLIGFSLETKDLIDNSVKKLNMKNLDMIVANNPNEENAGFEVDTNKVLILTKTKQIALPVLSKFETAWQILDTILQLGES